MRTANDAHPADKTDHLSVIAGDQPTTCPRDGTRTNWVGLREDEDGEQYDLEVCPHCRLQLHVYQPEGGEEE